MFRCPECGGETFVRSSDVVAIPILDPESGETCPRRRRYYQCKNCAAVRVVNFPLCAESVPAAAVLPADGEKS